MKSYMIPKRGWTVGKNAPEDGRGERVGGGGGGEVWGGRGVGEGGAGDQSSKIRENDGEEDKFFGYNERRKDWFNITPLLFWDVLKSPLVEEHRPALLGVMAVHDWVSATKPSHG